jgi:hypothetical protein
MFEDGVQFLTHNLKSLCRAKQQTIVSHLAVIHNVELGQLPKRDSTDYTHSSVGRIDVFTTPFR